MASKTDTPPAATDAAPTPQIQYIVGLTGGRWETVLQFDFAANGPDGKAVFPASGPQILEAISQALEAGRASVLIYGVAIRLGAYSAFRAG